MIDTNKYKKSLEEEKARLEEELSGVATKDSSSTGGWQATPPANDGEHADKNEVADHMEDLGDREAIESALETRLLNVNAALKRIEGESYGKCEVGGELHEIEVERMDANPAAKTCLEHLDQEMV